jgi:hypothetical protein
MILASTPLFCLSIPAIAQNTPAPNNSNSAVQDTRPAQSDRGQSTNTNQQQPTGDVNRQDNGINHGDLVVFDHFLDSHPEIAEQVRKHPSLLDNRRWVHEHQALETFLRDHSQLRGAISSNPDAFMQAEKRYDVREDARGAGQNAYSPDRDRDANVSNRGNGGVDRNREANTGDRDARVRDRDRDANSFNRDQNGAVNRDRDANASSRNQNGDADRDRNANNAEDRRGDFDRYRGFDRDHVSSFHDFMGQHRDIARDISHNPDRVNDQRYVENHPELKAYLNSNPGVRQDLISNPQTFVNVSQQVNVNVNETGTSGTTGTKGTSSTGSSTGNSTSGSGPGTSTTTKPNK